MKTIKHSLQFITELDENEPTAKRFLALPETQQVFMLEGLLKEVILPRIKPVIDEVNEGNSWALLKVVE
jgi:hypothetical protein